MVHITNGDNKEERIELYQELALKEEYVGNKIKDYSEFEWFNKAIDGKYPKNHDIDLKVYDLNFAHEFFENYTWENPDKYKDTNWYKFQESVKMHQDSMAEILEPILDDIEIENW